MAIHNGSLTSTHESRSAARDTAAIKKRPHVAYSRKPGKRCPFSAILPRRVRLMCGRAHLGEKDDSQIPARNVCRASSTAIGLPVVAQDIGEKLYGSWRLVSFKAQIVGEDAEPRDIFGPAPFGRLILTPSVSIPARSQTAIELRRGSNATAFYDGLHRALSS